MSDAPPDAVAVVPAHNESATVAEVVRAAARHLDAVLVIDDGSTDDTARVATDAGAAVHSLSPNRGKGGALLYGLDKACESGARVIVTLDADGEHDPDDIPALVSALADADIALGYREVYRSRARRLLNGLSLFWFRLLDPAIRDTICGFRAFRADVLPDLQNDAGGFAYEHEAVLRAVLHGRKITAVKVWTSPAQTSHVTPAEIVRVNNHFDRWVLRHLTALPIPLWRRALLAVGCVAGLAFGVPTEALLRRRARST